LRNLIRAATLIVAVTAGAAHAQENIKIGLITPLTGNSARVGQQAKAAVELGAEIVNGVYPEFATLPLAASAGSPNLKGTKLKIITADNQGNPSIGQKQTIRLVTEEQVVALLGAYLSSVTLAATAVAEQYGIPWVVGDSVAVNITKRGLKWTFRVMPDATDFAKSYMEFLNDLKQAGHPVSSIAIVYENTDYGTSVAASVREAAREASLPISVDISYSANTTDLASQVLQLRDKNPDAIIFASYTSDIIRYMKALKSFDYRPPVIIGDDGGFSDPAFVANVGNIAQGVLDRSAWEKGKPGSVTARINDIGSTKPDAIQQALRQTDLKPEQLMMGYRGVKFDSTGQNALAATYLIQLQGASYVVVWPEKSATAKLIYPFKGWQ